MRERLQAFGAALSKQPHLNAVRDGVVGSLPLILLGSVFLLLGQPPWPALAKVLPPAPTLLAGYATCAGLVSIYACAATALSLARRHEVDPVASVTTGLAVFLVMQQPVNRMLPMGTLGAAGLFPAFAAAIFAVEILFFFRRRQWTIRISGGAPDVVVRSFAALLPTVSCVVAVWLVVHVLHIDLAGGITAIFRPLLIGG
ncbi:MAG TPA: PTS transporter subunit EIIC, partial [Myxococcales bacterium]|nr:PTS transporter subunit EIIC [Myxococcales bacterium]